MLSKLNVPFCIVDATILTEAGYVGEDVESILSRLLMVADYDVEKQKKELFLLTKLIKLLENQTIRVLPEMFLVKGSARFIETPRRKYCKCSTTRRKKHPDQKYIQVNTQNILFIAGGAFDGIKEIIERRL